MNKINLFYFDNDLGEYDEYNPRFVFSNENVKRLIGLLSIKPFVYDKAYITKKLRISKDEVEKCLTLLLNVSAITITNEKIKINFPIFLNRDVKYLKKIVSEEILKLIEVFKDKNNELQTFTKNLYPEINPKLTLYHLLCGKIFDGLFFDYLESENILKSSYPKNDDRDFIVIGYQKSFLCDKFNKNLLCSFNNARFEKSSLSSFGTPNGKRLDYFRYFKEREGGKVFGKFKYLNNLFKNEEALDIVKKSMLKLCDIKNNKKVENDKYLKALIYTRYISKNASLRVPLFYDYNNKVGELYDYIIDLFGENIVVCLNSLLDKIVHVNLTSYLLGVDMSEVKNELWHMFFGMLNDFLISSKIVEKPKKHLFEGRYLKCVLIDQKGERK